MNSQISRRAAWLGTVCIAAVALAAAHVPASSAAGDVIEPGRFVWRDLMTRDVAASKRFYGQLFGWRFEDVRRGDRPYTLARTGNGYVGGLVDVSAMPNAAAQWLCFMAVTDVDKSVALVQADGGQVLVPPRDLPVARVAVVADPQGAPLGVARLQHELPVPSEPTAGHFFWQEYLARDDTQALAFYKRLAGYQSALTDSSLGIDYHVLRASRGRAGLFRLPPTADVEPNWLPYVLVADPAALASRVIALGGRILVPAAPDRRKGTLVVIADPGGAPLALQKYPF